MSRECCFHLGDDGSCRLVFYLYIYCTSPLPGDNQHFETLEYQIQLSAMVFLALGVVVVVLSVVDVSVSGVLGISPWSRQCLVQFLAGWTITACLTGRGGADVTG